MGAADAAVAAMPALALVCFDDVRRFVVFLIQFQNVAGAILHAAATLDAFLGIKNRRQVLIRGTFLEGLTLAIRVV